jgi:ADP-ribosylglycohydrolase
MFEHPLEVFGALRALPRTPFLVESTAKVREAVLNDVDIASTLGTGPLAGESVLAAQAIFLRSNGSFEVAVVEAAKLGGDVDSICAMVGCLAGALHGFEGIPPGWIRALRGESPSLDELIALADAVHDLPS